MNLEKLGVLELSATKLETTNGGLLFLAAIPLAKAFVWGVAAGLAIGVVVLDKILDKK